MSKDRDKLIAILNELEKDYHAGNIPKEKYTELRERYVYKIKTIDASNRIKSMQDRRNYSSKSGDNKNSRYPPKQGYNPKYNNSNRNYSRKPNGYDELQQSVHYNPNSNENAKTKSKSGTIAVGILCTVILLFAFGAGIAMGIFNMEGGNVNNGFSELVGAGASINDTAFPIVKKNVTSNFNSNSSKYSSNTTSYSTMNYSSYSGSSSDSGGSGSYSGGGSSSGSSSDSGGSSDSSGGSSSE